MKRSRDEEEHDQHVWVVYYYRDYRKENDGDVIAVCDTKDKAMLFRVEYIMKQYNMSEDQVKAKEDEFNGEIYVEDFQEYYCVKKMPIIH